MQANTLSLLYQEQLTREISNQHNLLFYEKKLN